VELLRLAWRRQRTDLAERSGSPSCTYTFADVPLNTGRLVARLAEPSKSISADPKSEALMMVSMPAIPSS
jgi:hypothetical protein